MALVASMWCWKLRRDFMICLQCGHHHVTPGAWASCGGMHDWHDQSPHTSQPHKVSLEWSPGGWLQVAQSVVGVGIRWVFCRLVVVVYSYSYSLTLLLGHATFLGRQWGGQLARRIRGGCGGHVVCAALGSGGGGACERYVVCSVHDGGIGRSNVGGVSCRCCRRQRQGGVLCWAGVGR